MHLTESKLVVIGEKDMEWVTVFKDYVPLFQTIIWVLFIVFGFSIFHKQLKEILGGVHQRITGVAGGGTFKASVGFASIEFSEAVRNLPTTDQATSVKGNALVSQWIEKRKQICENNRCIFLAHVFTPAKTSDQQFNFFIFLISDSGIITPHVTSSPLEDINYAEFFLGHAWGNRIFTVQNEGNLIGLSVSAYGTFLVVCRVVFKDGSETIIDSYIDFEMVKQVAKDGGVSK